MAAGATLQAGETVKRAIAGVGTVTATNDLTIGNSQQTGQFNQGGSPGVSGILNVGSNAVILLSADAAVLGSQTNIGPGGSLTALNGIQLGNPTSVDATKVLTATGTATINANFVNNGLVNGPTGSWSGANFHASRQGAGSTTGNVEYPASYHVGNSPDAVSVQNVLLDPTNTLIMELGGDIARQRVRPVGHFRAGDAERHAGLGTLGRLYTGHRRQLRHLQRPNDRPFRTDQYARLAKRRAMEYQQPLHERDGQRHTRALDARPFRRRCHRPCRLRLAATPSENCEASLRPARRPSHPVIPFAVVGERGTKGSLIQHGQATRS